MRNTLAILHRELKAYFVSPMGYFVIAAFFFLTSLLFYVFIGTEEFRARGALSLNRALMMNQCFILLLVVPAMTMRLFAEERKSGTIEILMTCPVRDSEVVLGKYLAALCLFGLMELMTVIHGVILAFCSIQTAGSLFAQLGAVLTYPHWQTFLSAYVGFFLLGASFIAMGTLTSSLTRSQLISAFLAFVVLLLLWVVDWIGDISQKALLKEIFSGLSLLEPFTDFAKGIVDIKHFFYYGGFITFCLFLTVKVIQSRKWR